MKKDLRKTEAEYRRKKRDTGGGPPPTPPRYTPEEFEIVKVLGVSITGLHNPCDSDATDDKNKVLVGKFKLHLQT
jgi:hypothetical protein